MSHQKQRTEKNCLNCQSEVLGRFCPNCGQENIEPIETAWHLITHFFNDITHFDGKFFSSIKRLITRPGFLSKEYVAGKRASYLNPVKMYVFTSFVFFLFFFSVNKIDSGMVERKINDKSWQEVEALDSLAQLDYIKGLDNDRVKTMADVKKYWDTVKTNDGGIRINGSEYKTLDDYNAALRSGKAKDNWIKRAVMRKQFDLNQKYQNDNGKILTHFLEVLFHNFPQMLFASLPIIALLLKLLYIRRKKYYYASHLIFSVHLYVFVFMLLLFLLGLSKLESYVNGSWINWVYFVGFLSVIYYTYRAMRNFYEQGRWKTIFKCFLLCSGMFFAILFLLIVFSFYSFLKT